MNGRSLNIFLVDDNDIDIVVNTKLLKLANLDAEILSFTDGPSSVAYIRKNHSELCENSNILLLDIQMPSVDGFETLKIFEELPSEVKNAFKVFMLSSSIDRSDIEKAEQDPLIIKVLEKPLDVYLLKRLVGIV